MKKNRTMKVAALLLALTLMTSCFVGGTFARYVTTGEKTLETARVAKWGVVIEVSGDTAFQKEYGAVVKSDTTDKVVAPGTGGTLFTMSVTGDPEVATEVVINAELELEGWVLEDGSSVYCPIVFIIGETEYTWAAGTSIEDFEKVVEDAITNGAGEYAPGELANKDLEIKWRWDLEGDSEKDTDLGDRAAARNAATISLNMNITIQQTGNIQQTNN